MDENRIAGTARNIGGKVEEGVQSVAEGQAPDVRAGPASRVMKAGADAVTGQDSTVREGARATS